jgi:hypothetical protein
MRWIVVERGVRTSQDAPVQRFHEDAELPSALLGERTESELQQVPLVRRFRTAAGFTASVAER